MKPGAHRQRRARRDAPSGPHTLCRAALIAPFGLLAVAAQAAVWTQEAALQVQALATDNSRPSGTGTKTSDLVYGVQPSLRLAARAPALNFQLDAAAAAVDSSRNTVQSSVQPRVNAVLGALLVPRLLTLNASATVRQSEADPFAGRVTDVSSQNRRTTGEYRVAPVLRWELPSHVLLSGRHEESLIKNAASAAVAGGETDLRGHTSLLRLERAPVPFGAAVQIDRDESRTEGGGQDITLEAARAQLSYAIVPADLVLGLVGGRERGHSQALQLSDSIHGVVLQWLPSPRTDVSARVEHRFFGAGGRLEARFRWPMSSLSLRAHREPATVGTGFGSAIASTDVALQAAGVVAARAVAEGAAAEGAPARDLPPLRSAGEAALGRRYGVIDLPGVIDIAGGYPQLESGFDAGWVYLGRRHSVSLQLYTRTLRQLTEGLVGPAPAAAQDSRQLGGALELTRQLAPRLAGGVTIAASRIAGQGTRRNDVTRQGDLLFSLNDQLSARTTLSYGLKFERVRSSVPSVNAADTTSLSMVLSHRF